MAIRAAITLALAFGASHALAETVSFQFIPQAAGANDMSPDGRWIVGEADYNGDGFPDGSYRWDRVNDVLTDLALSVNPSTSTPAVAVSDDGSIVLGNIPNPELDPNDPNAEPGTLGNVAGIWRESTGMWESLGYLPNAGTCPSRSAGYELSGDGTVACGLSWDGCNGRAFRWTAATGMQELEYLVNGSARASVMSADGSLLAGFTQGNFTRTPAVWSEDGNGFVFSAAAQGEINGIDDTGTVMLGDYLDANTPGFVELAAKWTSDGAGGWTRETIEGGALLPGWSGEPMDIANDGTIVGFDILLGNRRAWIQPKGVGPLIDLVTYIESHGGDVPDGLPLHVAQAISNDGRFIIGHGAGTGAWLVEITPDVGCPGDITGDNAVNLEDLAGTLASFGKVGPGLQGDLDLDGDVDLADLAGLLAEFGNNCD